ncbi:O-linked N-acetylglucosamine transferase, SPINDLY family protein [Parachlamydia acanthamoebae]|uniref:O-linked N-acetylglucosamine transferase, SPINDLY family protein n=1 Tax=Parachlamydia acanthamoebae TaxID=83552 RepID=UPI000750A21E|nr:tetratricopeptide repeat protein [Parachlamydia acanthamoebae]
MYPDIQQILTLAIEAHKAGKLEKAKELFEMIVLANPLNPVPHSFLGLIAIQNNHPGIAIQHFTEAVRLDPNNPLHHANLAATLLQTKQFEEALTTANKALALNADYPAALLSSGVALLSLGRIDKSLIPLQHLLTLYPDHIEGLYNLGIGMLRLKDFDAAEQLLRKVISQAPSHLEALLNLGICLFQIHRNEEVVAICERILTIHPNHIAARFILCFAHLPFIYENEEEITLVRTRYEQELLELHDLCMESTAEELSQAMFCVGLSQPFLLAYQGEDDRLLQTIYGDIIAKFVAARFPKWELEHPFIKHSSDKRIRVGIVSGFFKFHSNWKTHIQGWIKQINHKYFALFGYHTSGECDKVTEEARTYLERLTVGPKTLKEYCASIKEDKLDILIFPEIGMDSMTMRLAALRLAPVQCTSWGHPDTSGLQTIDYFLSSVLMEPPHGDDNYTEKLIRLPNLSIYYDPPTITYEKRSRTDFGLREEAILYWCCQVPIKYHPCNDEIFAKIVRDVPNAQLVFVESMPMIAHQFRNRLEKTFARFGLRANDYCVFLPKLNGKEFEDVTHLMDIFLDSVGWSGCNSSLESLAHNLPIVTLPGLLMRSRHTTAILSLMGMSDCIAKSEDDYIARAVSLGRHPEERSHMRKCIAMQKHLVYRDETTIIGLENFLKSAAGKRLK